MSEFNRTFVRKVRDALKNDPTLASYVKSFTLGDVGASRKLFPFIAVGNVRYEIKPVTNVSDVHKYSIEILLGTSSLLSDLAYEGNEAGKKGILQLKQDVTAVLRGNRFDGILLKPVHEIESLDGKSSDASGTVRLATVRFFGERHVMRCRS